MKRFRGFRSSTLPIIIALFAAPAGAVVEITLEDNHAVFDTDRMIVEVYEGVITRIYSKCTETEYLNTAPNGLPIHLRTGLYYAEPGTYERRVTQNVEGDTDIESGIKILVPTPYAITELPQFEATKDGDRVRFTGRWGHDDITMSTEYSIDPETGDLLAKITGSGKRASLAGARFSLGPVLCPGELMIPMLSGGTATRDPEIAAQDRRSIKWPTHWELPLVIFQDYAANGGLWVHTRDPEYHFKHLNYEFLGDGRWGVAFDTENIAPFDKHKQAESVTWRINTYRGNWTVPVDTYRAWAYDAYDIPEKKAQYQPEWVHDICLIIGGADDLPTGDIPEFLDLLAQHADPKRTLLRMSNWTDSDEVPRLIPHWIPNDHGKTFMREAQARGFRVMPYTLYFGISPNHPRVEEFKDYYIQNPYTGDYEGWNMKTEWFSYNNPTKLYYVNLGHKPWRDYVLEQFKAIEPRPDALFIDQTFLMFNDRKGLVNGMTTVESNLQFHKEMHEALPGIAIGGEGINEITMQYESFGLLWFIGVGTQTDSTGRTRLVQDPDQYNRMVPITTRFIYPHAYAIGGPATHCTIMSIGRPELAELKDPDGSALRQIRRAMAMEKAAPGGGPFPNLSSD